MNNEQPQENKIRTFAPIRIDRKAMREQVSREQREKEAREQAQKEELTQDFLPGGALARALAGYTQRCEQVEATYLIAKALLTKKNAHIEAATGTGKSLAYLDAVVRHVVAHGEKAVISTANKALQTQLMTKDAPFVSEHIAPFTFAEYKGTGNYACMDRVQRAVNEGQGEGWYDDVLRLKDYIEETNGDVDVWNGEFDNLKFSFSAEAKQETCADKDECAWQDCPFFKVCYLKRARDTVKNASVIIVNHSLLVIDAQCEKLLPPHGHVIIDEAHALEEMAIHQLETIIRQTRVSRLLNNKRVKAYAKKTRHDTAKQFELVWGLIESIYKKSSLENSSIPLPSGIEDGLKLASMLDELASELVRNKPELTEKESKLYDGTVNQVRKLADDLRTVFSVESAGKHIYQIKQDDTSKKKENKPVIIARTPLDVSGFLRSQLFSTRTCVSVSATLATGKTERDIDGKKKDVVNFGYYRQAVGSDLPQSIERILPAVFDYAHNALLYIPNNMPKPAYNNTPVEEKIYLDRLANEMLQLVKASRGRAFLLFTSKRALRAVHERIESELEQLGYPVFCQGMDMSTKRMVEGFKASGNGVLFGLKTFWEGVDVQGDALSLVAIDKLPFAPPDAMQKAREQRYKKAGLYISVERTIPEIIIRMKQGVGRLIRTHEDRGVMAIIDARMHPRTGEYYAKNILDSLPPAPVVHNIEQVASFFSVEDSEVRNG